MSPKKIDLYRCKIIVYRSYLFIIFGFIKSTLVRKSYQSENSAPVTNGGNKPIKPLTISPSKASLSPQTALFLIYYHLYDYVHLFHRDSLNSTGPEFAANKTQYVSNTRIFYVANKVNNLSGLFWSTRQ